jgi:hypothetical protein
MDQDSLVERQVDDGAKVAEKLRESGIDVTAAWWMKASEEGQWFLYIASKEVDEQGIATAYRTLHTVVLTLGPLWVDRFDIKLVGRENPLTREVLDILARYPGRMPIRPGRKKLGNVSIDDSYIYPPPVPA